MNNKVLLLLFLIPFISCHDCEFEMNSQVVEEFNNYYNGQIVYFESNKSDLDTIKISTIDSIEVCNSIMVQDYKIVQVRIEHLPLNKWQSRTSGWDNENKKVINNDQALIEVDMRFGSDGFTYTKWIEFRDFFEEIQVASSDKEVIDTISRSSLQGEIDKVYWSNKKGLIGYEKSNGQIYKIKNVVMND